MTRVLSHRTVDQEVDGAVDRQEEVVDAEKEQAGSEKFVFGLGRTSDAGDKYLESEPPLLNLLISSSVFP